MRKIIYIITTLILLSISFILPVNASYQSGAGTKVTANIPSKVDLRIYGYTAPFSIVQASSIRVFAQVSSDKTGYFMIDPLSVSNEAREICLTTIDSEHRSGFPVCIGIPNTNKPVEIGPILLSPTISLSGNNLIQSSTQSTAQGQTLPEADVEIAFFENTVNSTQGSLLIPPPEKSLPRLRSGQAGHLSGVLRLIRQAEAKEIPKITTKTDSNGSFSINLPAARALSYRISAKAFYLKSPTPNSQTLVYSVTSYTSYWLKNILPRIIFLLLFMLSLLAFIWWEIKTGKGREGLKQFNETRWKPFVVRSYLTRRRIWYNFRARLKSDRI